MHMHSRRPAKTVIAGLTLTAAIFLGPTACFAAATNTNASAGVPANAQQLINGAANLNLSVNSPAGQAAAAATATAQSPEMQKAVTSVWALAWESAWPFIKSMFSGFFGLFVTAWHSATVPTNVNAAANVNASSSAP